MQIKISKPLFFILLAGIFSGGIIINQFNVVNFDSIFCSGNKFQYINKELACGGSFVVKKQSYGKLKIALGNFIQEKTKENVISEVSVYFRDLNNGPTLGLNEYNQFAPASLLKLPMMMTYLSLSENDPRLLKKELKFRRLKEVDFLSQNIAPEDSIKENTPYTISELLRYMISYSDNNAYFTLVQYLNQQYPDGGPFFDTMSGLGIIQPNDFSENNLTVKSYASIFVQLYHASFFEKKETSEEALALLAAADYNDGLVSGVPTGIEVAHKFGERTATDSSLKQLHDCGIVYYPKNPYLLCVMTRGKDLGKLSETIGLISRMFYEEFDARRIQ